MVGREKSKAQASAADTCRPVPFALDFFQELKTLTGDFQWCGPNKQDNGHVDVKVMSEQVGNRQARFKR